MNHKLLLLSILLLSTVSPIKSHSLSEIHNLCERAKDYQGCIETNSIQESTKKQDEWRSYGPLRINHSLSRRKDENVIYPALNENGNYIFIAVNCTKLKINTTGSNTTWKGWLPPIERFESEMLVDICNL